MHLVAVGGHDVEDFELRLHDLVVGLAADELEPRPAAEGRIAVGDAIALEPVEVLVVHRGADLRRSASRRSRCTGPSPKRRWSMTSASWRLPSSFRWTPLMVSGFFAFPYSAFDGLEEIDVIDAVGLRDLFHRLGVELECSCAAASPVGQVRRLVVLERQSARRAPAAGPSCRCTSARACA